VSAAIGSLPDDAPDRGAPHAGLGALLDLPRQLREMMSHPLSAGRRPQVLRRWLAWHIGSRLAPGPVLVPFVNGTSLLAAPGWASVTWNHYVGLAEPGPMAFVAHLARADDLLFDVGANAGLYTALACATAGCRCVAFEPHPTAAWMLERNLAVNDLRARVTVRRAAVGSAPGVARLTLDAGPMNHVLTSGVGQNDVEVPLTTLDAEAAELGPPSLLKIDVEGYEYAVLAGAGDALRRPELRAIVVEINRHTKRYGQSLEDVFATIRGHGFAWVEYDFRSRSLTRVPGLAREGTHLFVRDVAGAQARLRAAPAMDGPGFSV
jgi:FkbM family methyltransferase